MGGSARKPRPDSPRVADELQLVLDALPDDRASGEFREQIREETAPEHT